MNHADAQVSCTHLPIATGDTTILENTWPRHDSLTTEKIFRATFGCTTRYLLPEQVPKLHSILSAAQRHLDASTQPGHSEQERGAGSGHSFVLTAPQVRIPVWTSRDRWLIAVAAALATSDGDHARAGNVSVHIVYTVAKAMSEAADHLTGRHSALSRSSIAQRAHCSIRSVAYARCTLERLGLAVEVVRGRHLTRIERIAALTHHGRRQIRAASTWALTLTRVSAKYLRDVDKRPGYVDTCTPPSQGECKKKAYGSKWLPRARKRTQVKKSPPTRKKPPLKASQLAGQIIRRAPNLWKGHSGLLARLLDDHMDVEQWSCSQLFWVLDTDTANRGWNSPEHYTNPAGWWTWKLQQCAEALRKGPPPGLVYG